MQPTTKQIGIIFLLVSFCLGSLLCVAQDFEEPAYRGELLRWQGLPIDSLWQFNSSASMQIAEVTSANEGWQTVNTETLQNINGGDINWQGIGWFRKNFTVPEAWRGKPVALRLGHFGASEIFLDGKPVAQYGLVANSIEKEKIFIPRKGTIIQLDSGLSHTLLVHYSNQHAYTPGYPSKFGFRLFLAPSDTTFRIGLNRVPIVPITIGVLLIFSIFFLFVYFFDTKRLASLLTALMLINFCSLFIGIFFVLTLQEWSPIIRVTYFLSVLSQWLNCLQLLVLYTLYFNGKMPRLSWLVIGIMLLWIFKSVLPATFSDFFNLLSLLIVFEIFRILISGVLQKKTGFWILLIGAIIQQTGVFVLVLDIFKLFPIMTKTQEVLIMVIPQMGVPLTYALHLAWEFGKANHDLRLQLVQVNELSEKTLQQEQEKQEILTQQKDKLEGMVDDRTKQLSQQKETLQNTLTNLKATQGQLIQSEKMASLGELTAGIAHEIQNPLNFVNNFSEVSNELLDEMKTALATNNNEEAIIIADDVKQNLEKILHHGKRADAIVKGMLQHSQSSTGVKELTDINKLVDEYLRLAYHGLRAKDTSFNATIKTDFDSSLEKVNIIPQDIGRVILNLINNAFYACTERSRSENELPDMEAYEPTVTVSTKKEGDKVFIAVKDNGNGINQKIVGKIFQPFFTTKPTGQGTGLGLSLSYDIVTKGHDGEITVASEENKGSVFTIILLING